MFTHSAPRTAAVALIMFLLLILAGCHGKGGGHGDGSAPPSSSRSCVWGSSTWDGCQWGS